MQESGRFAFRRLIADRGAPQQEAPDMHRLSIATLVVSLLATSAHAHAVLIKSEPASGASVPAGPVTLTFRYNSRIDRNRSRLTLIEPDRRQLILKLNLDGSTDLLQSQIDLATPGDYVVRWQVLAVDGHITRGDVPFTVTGH
jgi:methionine-rich copper-binding protein CopC